MPLQRQEIEIPLISGTTENIDEKHLPPERLKAVLNGKFDYQGTINKRNGYTTGSNSSLVPFAPGTAAYMKYGYSLFPWGSTVGMVGKEGVAGTDAYIANRAVRTSHLDRNSNWTYPTGDDEFGRIGNPEIVLTPIGETRARHSVASAYLNDHMLIASQRAWNNTDVADWYLDYWIVEVSTGIVKFRGEILNYPECYKVVAVGNYLVLVYLLSDGAGTITGVYQLTLDTSSSISEPIVAAVTSDFAPASTSNPYFGVTPLNTIAYLLTSQVTGGKSYGESIRAETGVAITSTKVEICGGATIDGVTSCQYFTGPVTTHIAVMYNNANYAYLQVFDIASGPKISANTNWAAPVQLQVAISAGAPPQCAAEVYNTGAAKACKIWVFTYFLDDPIQKTSVRRIDFENANESGTYYLDELITSEGFAVSGEPCIIGKLRKRTSDDAVLSSSYTFLSIKELSERLYKVDKKLSFLEQMASSAAPTLGKSTVSTDGTYLYVAVLKDIFIRPVDDDTVITEQVVCFAKITPTVGLVNYLQIGGVTLLGAGQTYIYDGVLKRAGGTDYIAFDAPALAEATGTFANGVYSYCAVIEWVDNLGKVYRTEASPVGSITLSAPHCIDVDLTAISIYASSIEDDEIPLSTRIKVYRTEADGSIFYELYNYHSWRSITTFTDTTIDADLVYHPTLYTTGGVIGNINPPACRIMTSIGNRVVMVPITNPIQVWVSKEHKENYGLEFSDLLTFNHLIDGNITALATLDDKLVIFKKDATYIMPFYPLPNDLGQGAFPDAQKIATIGTTSWKTAFTSSVGVIFQSSLGIHLLDRGGNITHIGEAVKSYETGTILRIIEVRAQEEIRFLMSTGKILVYHTNRGQWTISEPALTFIDHCVSNDVIYYLTSGGTLYKENTSFRDNTTAIPLSIETAWFHLDKLQGFQRLYEILLLGDYKSPHTLNVSIYYDFSDTASETVTKSFTADPAPYQVRIRPSKQKCTAVKFKIWDSSPTTNYESYSLSSVTLTIGKKQGLTKKGSNRHLT